MSRSYRKSPFITDTGKHCKYAKRHANKVVRRETCGNGGEFKKHFDSWKIKDWKFRIRTVNTQTMSK